MNSTKAVSGNVPEVATTPQADAEHPKPVVVGIGTSAGGLAALRTFLALLPADPGMAFVVVIHLAPERKSHLVDLLQSCCKLPIIQVCQTTALEADHVYIIPPDANLNSVDTHLRLTKLEEARRDRAPIDHFFETLAQTHDGESIGVILTGTGSDGTQGLRSIKQQRGVTIVQDPDQAEYDGMPRSAIAAGVADLILPLEQIPSRIIDIVKTKPNIIHANQAPDENQLLGKIFAHIRQQTGHDFSQYKHATVLRRISRRMQLHQLENLLEYDQLLQDKPHEITAVFEDLLINVTEFFRDDNVYEMLEKQVIPELFEHALPKASIRVWSVGCSTGEEAYSLAMLLIEEASRRDTSIPIQVFASDLHENSLRKAREGIYPKSIASKVSAERLRRFFTKEADGYRVRNELRETIIFAEHNLIKDPPFSHLNMIVCRNVMIYLQRGIQEDLVNLFHYGLNPDGLLLLGTAETVDDGDLFKIENKAICLYRKRNLPSREPRLPVFPSPVSRTGSNAFPTETASPTGEGYGVIHCKMVEQYAPPSILVNRSLNIVHSSINSGHDLQHPAGESTQQVLKLVHEPLKMELRTAVHIAREQNRVVHTRPVELKVDGQLRQVIVSVRPAESTEMAGYLLIIFDEVEARVSKVSQGDSLTDNFHELQAECDIYKQRLDSISEGYETTQGEMRAANEEMQSTNEELRSTMEELETSKEELQSINEELSTVNQENRHRVEELDQLSSDLNNLLTSTQIATVFLDRELRIVRYTPKLAELFNIRAVDKGRPLSDLTHHLSDTQIQDDAQRVLDHLTPIEREVQAGEGRWYTMRIMPYRTGDDRIEGVVVTLVDITERKNAEEQVHQAKEYAEQIIQTMVEPLLVLTSDLHIKTANASFCHHFKVTSQRVTGQLIFDLGNGQWDIPSLRKLIEDILPHNHAFNDYQVQADFESIGPRVMLLNGRKLEHQQLVLLGITDITQTHLTEVALRESELRYRTLFDSIDEGFGIIEVLFDDNDKAVDYLIVEVNPAFEQHSGIHQATGRRMKEITPNLEEYWFELLGDVALTGQPVRVQQHSQALKRFFDVYAFRVGNPDQKRLAVVFTDITSRKQTEMQLAEAREQLEKRVAERTQELQEQTHRLRRLSGELSATERRERKRLAALLHDDLQQTLAAAKMRLSHLREDPKDDTAIKTVDEVSQMITQAISSSRDLTRQLRPPGLYEAGLVAALNWLAGDMKERHELQVTIQATDDKLNINDDMKSMLFEVVRELLFNVVKHATVKQAIVRVIRYKQQLQIYVEDKGEGFETSHEDHKEGFGLFSVRERLENMGGTLEILSEPGAGTQILLSVPEEITESADKAVPARKRAAKVSRSANVKSDTVRLLIVDDHTVVREGIARLLSEDKRLTVVAQAPDGQKAIEAIEQYEPHVVLIDINMPIMNGVEATREISRRWPDVRIVAMSVQDDSTTQKTMYEAGAAAVVSKSATSAQLISAVLDKHD